MSIALAGYRNIEKISEGTKIIVYRGERVQDRQQVAIAISTERYPSLAQLKRFRNQYIITYNLNIDGVVKIYALEKFGNGYALIMENFSGISWLEYVATNNQTPSRQQLLKFLQIAIRVVETLAELDRNHIIHQKIQPQNILIAPHSQQVKLKDFSLASLLPKNRQLKQNLELTDEILPYISPEQTGRIDRGIDYRSDFYALGITFYQLLTEQLPFTKSDPIELIHCHLAAEAIAPIKVNTRIPLALSKIVLKLIAKNPEERYQTAWGLKCDLETCRQQLQDSNKISNFSLGTRDICDRPIVPHKLYGREKEIETILNAYERVCRGKKELLVVSGCAGIGKTALIERVSRTILQQPGYFVRGKFEQFLGNRPLAAIFSAFQSLILQLQTESIQTLQQWRHQLLQALGDNGQLVIDVIPELETIIGKQPSVTKLEPDAARNRFTLILRKFIRLFATAEHPLIIFFDDLQWADLASLKFIQLLMGDRDFTHLLLIGAYRDNEVSAAHPLAIKLAEIEGNVGNNNESVAINRLGLSPLNLMTLNSTIADSLCCSEALAFPLTESIWQKTQGNPFFAIELLYFLHQEGLITLDRAEGYWQCDLAKVKVLAVSDDVVEFMTQRLTQLSADTQSLLTIAACIGNEFDLATLAIVCGKSELDTVIELRHAIQESLVLPTSEIYQFALSQRGMARSDFERTSYQFLHDRLQQAAYQLITQSERVKTHWRIGQLLLERNAVAAREEKIFAIVHHLNMAVDLIQSRSQRELLAELNLNAGNKAKAANAFFNAWQYCSTGLELLTPDCWETKYDLTLDLTVTAAEAAYLCGNFKQMKSLVATILQRGRSLLDRVRGYEVKIYAYIALGEPLKAVKVTLEVLELLGVRFPLQPNKLQLLEALVRTKLLLAKQDTNLIDLPRMSEPQSLAVMKIIGIVGSPAYNSTPNLVPLLALRAVNLSLKQGNTAMSIYGYASYGVALCGSLGQFERGYQFGQLALNLLEKLDAEEFKAKTLMVFNNFIRHWQEHPQAGLGALKEAYCSGLETGDLEFASYAVFVYSYHSYLIGKELTKLEREISQYLEAIALLNQETAHNLLKLYHQITYNLSAAVEAPIYLKGQSFDEDISLPLLLKANHLSLLCHLYCHKLILCYLFEKYTEALVNANNTQKYLHGVKATLIIPLFNFYDSLTRLAVYNNASRLEKKSLIKKVTANQKQLKIWAKSAPMNYWHKYYLVAAEQQRVLGNYLQAIDNYDRAIELAELNKYSNDLALAQELAAKFYLTWGKRNIARLYLTDAYYSYARWGAIAKVKNLAKNYSQLLAPVIKPEVTLTEETKLTNLYTSKIKFDRLDLKTIIKTTQAISQEIKLDKLLATLIDIVVKSSGAQTGALILLNRESTVFLAAATIQINSPIVEFDRHKLDALQQNLPNSILNQVKFTAKPVILAEGIENTIYLADPYFVVNQPQSILCTPILDRQELIGILYLENKVTKNVFTDERLEVINILCSQAAISLKNANLYLDIQHSEDREKQKVKQLETSLVQLQQDKQQLEYDAFHDSLTGLANRALLIKLLAKSIELAARHPQYLYAFLFLDLDRFKIINDSFGHLFGDELLKQVAQRLVTCVRTSDTVSRLGGDEFAILLENLEDTNEAIIIARRIIKQFLQPFFIVNKEIYTSTSIGITFSTINYQQPKDILQDADIAMYRAKSQEKGQYFIFDPTLEDV
ncbi:diguanylate cyclase domain-containing protein [Myxosarcina sp. GI1]|uniref:diguanylate cyclase domain-containing protein n=1 Tax=Myxosarcina sp. GI1 TaxID=1541065 RepID=UPI00068D58F6|nr:diguanylate cyclase [Myxosarcina sp. GI1]